MQINIRASKPREISTPPVIDIELFALDLNSCTRCVGTLDHIEKAIDIVRKTWKKMSERGHEAALGLELPERSRGLVGKALGG